MRESIRAHGFYGALVVQRATGHILVGNHRYLAAVAEGYLELPVHYVDVDDTQALRILAVDNRASDLATYDERALAELLESLSDETALAGTLYDAADVEVLLQSSGILGERNAAFLDELCEGATSVGALSAGGEVSVTGLQPRQLVIVATPEQRAEIVFHVRAIKETRGLDTAAEAILVALRAASEADYRPHE